MCFCILFCNGGPNRRQGGAGGIFAALDTHAPIVVANARVIAQIRVNINIRIRFFGVHQCSAFAIPR